jgi:glycosyltransferase involved in cell wall biosynthesis
MRILHLSSLYPPTTYGGAEKVVETLAEGMAARGVETAVAHLVRDPSPESRRNDVWIYPLNHRNPLWIATSAEHTGIVRNFNKVATLFNFLTNRDFDALLEAYAPDIVHTHSMVELTPWMWDVAKARGAKIVHTLHDYDLLCIRGALFKDGRNCSTRHLACSIFSEFKRHYHRHVDHVVGVSNSILQTHLAHGLFQSLPEQNRHVVWNPVGVPVKESSSRRVKGPFTFGFLGRLVPEKGIDLLLRSCRDLPGEGWKLKIAGHLPTRGGMLREQGGRLPVEFVGYADSTAFLRGIDVLIVPSIWAEPFGLTVVEAYGSGVPVLGADSGGLAEIIGSVDRAWLFPRADGAALTQKMRELIARGRDCSGLRPNFSEVLKRTDPGYVVGRYLEIYRGALEQARSQEVAPPKQGSVFDSQLVQIHGTEIR